MAEPERVLLVCPACRTVDGGQLRVRTMRLAGSLLVCGCGRRYPVIDGIPVVLRDVAGWAESEGPSALARPGLDPGLTELVAVDAASRRNRKLVQVYASMPTSPLRAWLAEFVASAPGPVVELGSGVGHPGTVRADLNLSLLRAGGPVPPLVESPDGVALLPGGAVVADAGDPPFLAESFKTVLLVNVLDSCADPALALAQADALVARGGELVVTCAFAFDDGITPPERQFSERTLENALAHGHAFGAWAPSCTLTEPPVDLEWRLAVGPRTEHVHRVRVYRARRRRDHPIG